jgi:hypothetical protein
MADELVAEGAADAGDAELEPDLLERRGVAGLETALDELRHLLARDAAVVDAPLDLHRRQRGVGRPVGDVERPDGVLRVVEQLDLDGHGVPRREGAKGLRATIVAQGSPWEASAYVASETNAVPSKNSTASVPAAMKGA